MSSAASGPLTVAKCLEAARSAEPEMALNWLAEGARLDPSLTQIGSIASQVMALPDIDIKGWRSLRVFVTGNATLKPVCDGLTLELLMHGIQPKVLEGPFDSWGIQLTDPQSDLHQFAPAVVVIVFSALGLTAGGTRIDTHAIDALEAALKVFRRHSQSPVLIVLPEPLEEEADPVSPLGLWRAGFSTELRRRLTPVAVVLDPTPVVIEQGSANWYAPRFWYHGKLPAHPKALSAFGRWLSPVVAHCVNRPVKVVACDLDNTLWGGIVGEIGWQKLLLDPFGSGGAYARLQAFLKRLTETGIVLAAVSKNNRSDVLEVFERRRSDLVLGWDDFVAHYVNWEPKSANLLQLARDLNVDPSAICFLDDQPFERAEVRNALPGVIVPELPKSADEVVPFLARSGLFSAPVITTEDLHRSDYYHGEAQRQQLDRASEGDRDIFLRSLNIEVTPLPIDSETFSRVVQLIHKTNQFNLTTRRHDATALTQLLESKGAFGRCYSVKDRFGDSGITGVLLGVARDSALLVDTWLLSCRVMGRDVERAMLQDICTWARSHGYNQLLAEFRPTSKNVPVAELLPTLGFSKDDTDGSDRGLYALDLVVPMSPLDTVALSDLEDA